MRSASTVPLTNRQVAGAAPHSSNPMAWPELYVTSRPSTSRKRTSTRPGSKLAEPTEGPVGAIDSP